MIKLLIIDDQEASIQPLKRLLEGRESVDAKWCDFDEAEETIRSFLPHVIVLDILADSPDGVPSVEQSSVIDKFIWNVRFCPVIVYSAQPDLYPEEQTNHPFVRTVSKGLDSEIEVVESLDQLTPYIEALKKAENHVRDLVALAMRYAAPYAFEAHSCKDDARETTARMGRRRLAALMDEVAIGDQSNLRSWEMYLCPPVSKDFQLGDVLQDAQGNSEEPDSFRLVLSPSCDMVSNEHRAAKISHVLVARCCSIDQALIRLNWGNIGNSKLDDPSRLGLSRGYIEHIVFLPALSKRIPTMAADMRKLELIPFNDIDTGQNGDDSSEQFVRIASIDSPFREAIMWAYLQTAGRPGLPDRDIKAWSREIVDARKSK